MEGNRVYLAACPDYGQAEAKLREAVAALGGMERFVRPGERILLKANLLRAAPPESAICTHPAVAAAAAKLVAEAGGTAVITDSPGGALHKEAVLRGLHPHGVPPCGTGAQAGGGDRPGGGGRRGV